MHFTVVNMPLVRTPMVEPTRLYQRFPLISSDRKPPEEHRDPIAKVTSDMVALAALLQGIHS
jgi:hypothetical protein